jgi:hypothetical protein
MPIFGITASSNMSTKLTDFYQIATTTLGSAQSSIEFTGIPSTYTHLQIRGIGITSIADRSIYLQFNSDNASNYSTHYLQGNGTTASSGANATNYIYLTSGANTTTYPFIAIADILDYANTNKYKTTRSIGGADMNGAGGYAGLYSGNWRNTNAITSIKIIPNSGNLSQYSSFQLYGVIA